ncbi:MAG: sulfotransferase [Kiloniellaceae bacterium]
MRIGLIAQLLCSPASARKKAAAACRYAERLESQLASFDTRFDGPAKATPPPVCGAAPVFILSAGWRSGSTLLQRMVMAKNPEIIIWGEPYAAASPIQTLADQLRPFSESWPDPAFFVEEHGADLAAEWVANLYPPAASFRAAHLAYVETLFAQPARELGRRQWGLKEVRFGADQVHYLRWLYPQAKFVFLIRNPLDAYLSYRGRLSWYARWPDRMVSNPYAFGAHWARLSREFLALQRQSFGPLVRYEALGEEATAATLRDYLGWEIPPLESMAQVKGWTSAKAKPLRWVERSLLRRATGTLVEELGYV